MIRSCNLVQQQAKHPLLGAFDVLTASLLLFAVWGALPARWWPVDLLASILAVLFFVCGIALVAGSKLGHLLGIWTAALALIVGCPLITVLAATATELAGIYGPVGRGTSIILWIVFFLLVPYLVLLPAAQLFLLLDRSHDTQVD